MTDMPQVKPRDIHALLAAGVETHVAVRDSIAKAADERTAYYEKRDQELNASARLAGKTAP